MIRVYLAGSYSCPEKEQWRKEFIEKTKNSSIKILDPHDRKKDMNANEIFSRDIWAIRRCNVLLTYSNKTMLGIGTSQEMIYAKYLKKQVILVAPEESVLRKDSHGIHPFLQKCCDSIVFNIDDAIGKIKKSDITKLKDVVLESSDYFEKTLLDKDDKAKNFISD